jgi:hypothetical protein
MPQIHHAVACDVVKYALPIVMPMAELLIVVALYSVIRLSSSLNALITLTLMAVGLVAGMVLKLGIDVAVRVTEKSETIRALALRKGFTKADIRFFRSCRPLKWKIGSTFTITRETFPHILNEIIIANVINLLVAF